MLFTIRFTKSKQADIVGLLFGHRVVLFLLDYAFEKYSLRLYMAHSKTFHIMGMTNIGQ